MKKISLLLIMMVLLAMMAGAAVAANKTIVTTFYPIYIAVLNITEGVAGVEVVNLAAPATGCLHDYHPTPGDWAVLAKADVVVANGAGMEDSFLRTVVRRWPAKPVIEASTGIELLKVRGETNAHVWVSPARHILQIRSIAQQLVVVDPAHASQYLSNAERYKVKLEALKNDMESGLKNLTDRRIMTFHEAFDYFASDFALQVVAVVEREPGTAPSAGELAALVQQVRKENVKVLFVEPQYPAGPADVITRETGAVLRVLDPIVTGPIHPDAYLNAMRSNLVSLQRALSR